MMEFSGGTRVNLTFRGFLMPVVYASCLVQVFYFAQLSCCLRSNDYDCMRIKFYPIRKHNNYSKNNQIYTEQKNKRNDLEQSSFLINVFVRVECIIIFYILSNGIANIFWEETKTCKQCYCNIANRDRGSINLFLKYCFS